MHSIALEKAFPMMCLDQSFVVGKNPSTSCFLAYPVDEVSSNNKRVTGDDDEEAWLDALESGDVNERGLPPGQEDSYTDSQTSTCV